MEHFEYDITHHDGESFMRIVYYCSERGDCKVEGVPGEETRLMAEVLNVRGREGWELVQLLFGRDGVLAVWKRRIAGRSGG